MNGRWKSETRGSWTAISRAPYLKALALFAKGDCWNGGGLWLGNMTYWINDGAVHTAHTTLRDTRKFHRNKTYRPDTNFGGECQGVYYPRLMRDGWSLGESVDVARWHRKDFFEKPLTGGWVLRKIAHGQLDQPAGKGCYWDEHELVHAKSGTTIACPDWEWADRDGKRLAWAAGGKLFRGRIGDDSLADVAELYDFSGMTFTAIEAPY